MWLLDRRKDTLWRSAQELAEGDRKKKKKEGDGRRRQQESARRLFGATA